MRGSCDGESKTWMDEIRGLWRAPELNKVHAEHAVGERNGLSELCKIGYVVWE